MSTTDEKTEARKKARLAMGPFYERLTQILPGWAWALVFLALAILFGAVGQEAFGQDFYDAMITTLAFVMMALGLNIVVGFAGLLDLGYVAFYAIGAFVAGWFMSGQPTSTSSCPTSRSRSRASTSTSSSSRSPPARSPPCGARSWVPRRCACGATTWRS